MKKRNLSLFSILLAFMIFLFGVVLISADLNSDSLALKARAVSVGDQVDGGVVVADDASFCGCCHAHNHGNTFPEKVSCIICRIKHVINGFFGNRELNPVHKYIIISVTDATCTTEGCTHLRCAVCGIIKNITSETLPHSPVEVPAVPATCSSTGCSEGTKCDVCGAVLSGLSATPKTAHTLVVLPGVRATCTSAGLTDGKQCSVCGVIINAQNVIPAAPHIWNTGVVTTEPTCISAGVKVFTCWECGATRTEEIGLFGHSYIDVVTPPTCTEQGYTTHTCSRCGYHYTDAYTNARHDFIDGTVVNNLTVAANSGKVTADYTCAVCGAGVTGGEIPAVASANGYEEVYHTLQAAVINANGGNVYLLCDYTLKEDLTIPAGVTVIIPCITGDMGYTARSDDGAYNLYCHDNPGTEVAPAKFRTLTVARGVTVSVNGTLLINAVTGAAAAGFDDYGITGNYACIDLGGTVIVPTGGAFDCSGYVYDNGGEILAQSGAKLLETFGVMRWRGGSYAYAAAMKSSVKCCFPIENYDFNYIRAKLTVEYGALYYGTVKMYASGSYYYCHFPQISSSSNALYLLSEGASCVRTVTASGKAVYKFYGDVTFSSTKLKVANYQMGTDKCGYFKLDGNTQLEFYNGTVTCNKKYHFLPGFRVVVGTGAALNIGSGGGMLFSTATNYTLNGKQYYSYYYYDQQYATTTKWYIPGRGDAAMYILDGGSVNVAGTEEIKAEIAGRVYLDDASSFTVDSGTASESISRYVAYGSVSGSSILAKVNMNQYETVLLRSTLDAAAKAAAKTALGLE